MIIEKIYINSFGGLQDFTLEFGSGINITEGPNESGKTAAASFCAYVLYGFDKGEKNLRIGRGSLSAGGYLELQSEGKRYRIERETFADGRERLKATDLSDHTSCMKGVVPGEFLLGIPSELFTHTSYVSQAQGTAVGGSGVYEALENILFSGDEAVNIQKAQKRLDEARIALLYKNEKGGRIAELKKEREQLAARFFRASESNKKIILTEASLAEAKEKLRENITNRTEYELRLKYYDAGTAIRLFDRLHILKAEESRLIYEIKKINDDHRYEDFLPDVLYITKLRETEAEAQRLREELHACELDQIRFISSETDREKREERITRISQAGGKSEILKTIDGNQRKTGLLRSSGILFFALCFCFLTAAVLYLLNSENIVFSVYTGIAAIASLIFSVILFRYSAIPRRINNELFNRLNSVSKDDLVRQLDESREDEIRIRFYYERISEFKQKHDRIAAILDETQSELESQLNKWGRQTVSEAVSDAGLLFSELQKRIRDLESCRTSIGHITEQTAAYDETAVRESFKTLTDEFKKIKNAGDEAPPNIPALRMKYDFSCKQNDSLTERCHLLDNQLAELRAVTEKPAQLADRIYAVDEELASAVRRHKACMFASEQLAAAAEGLRTNITPALSEESGKLLSSVTEGRYGSLGVGSDMNMVYTVHQKNGSTDTRSIDYMSTGTRDLAYLSLRLALMSLIHTRSVPPVIFDESFARIDDRRLRMTFRLIAEYAENGYQAILFTSQKRDAVIMTDIAQFKHILL